MERLSVNDTAEEWVTWRQNCHEIERHIAMNQGVYERDAGWNLTTMLQHLEAQLIWHREMLTRVKEFDGDNDKLLAEYQHDIHIESGKLIRRWLRGRVQVV